MNYQGGAGYQEGLNAQEFTGKSQKLKEPCTY